MAEHVLLQKNWNGGQCKDDLLKHRLKDISLCTVHICIRGRIQSKEMITIK
jgi:hypothetical protein